MQLRQRRNHVYLELTDDLPLEPVRMTNWAEIPSVELEKKELREDLAVALTRLPEKYREVLVLRDIEGFSIVEAAEILGLSQVAVKVRLMRARLKMRDLLATKLCSKAPRWGRG